MAILKVEANYKTLAWSNNHVKKEGISKETPMSSRIKCEYKKNRLQICRGSCTDELKIDYFRFIYIKSKEAFPFEFSSWANYSHIWHGL